METLELSFTNLDIMKHDFKTQMKKFIKQNIQQTWTVMCGMMHFISSFYKPTDVFNDVCSSLEFHYSSEEIRARTMKIVDRFV